MTPLRPILLAEDNPADVELTLSALHSLNLANEIVVVHDGEQVLDFLHRRGNFAGRAGLHPAVILLDLKMPRVDGLEVLRHVRGEESLRAIPIVMLTSSREEQDIVRSYALGSNAYVVKPVDFEAFMQAIGRLGVFWAVLNEPAPARA